jgi:hypothetical protein
MANGREVKPVAKMNRVGNWKRWDWGGEGYSPPPNFQNNPCKRDEKELSSYF